MQLRGRECPMCRKYVGVVRPFPRFIEMDHSAYDNLKSRYDDVKGQLYLLEVERNVVEAERDALKVERDALQARNNQLHAQLDEQKQRDLAVRMETCEDRRGHLEADHEPLRAELAAKLEEIELRLHTYRAEQARHEAGKFKFGLFRTNPSSSSPTLPSAHNSGPPQFPGPQTGISPRYRDLHARALRQHRFPRPT